MPRGAQLPRLVGVQLAAHPRAFGSAAQAQSFEIWAGFATGMVATRPSSGIALPLPKVQICRSLYNGCLES